MHLKSFSSLIAMALLAAGARAADQSPANTVSMPSSPAPQMAPAAAPTPNQIVYTPRLPSATELTNAAAAQGLTVERLEQTANQIVAVYRTSSGQINTVAYQTLPPSNGSASAQVVTPSAPPVIVYEQPAPRPVYYYDDPVYYPGVWYPPVALSFGFGFGHRFGGGFRGGFHHWR
jgi:hypothetical protein